IAESSIDYRHLTPGAIESLAVQDDSITGNKIADGTITSQHLADEAVTEDHLAPASVFPKHMSFTPIRSTDAQPAVQQYGLTAFAIPAGENTTEVIVNFEEPFASVNYVIVAMSNHPGFQVSLKLQRSDVTVLEVTRQPNCNSSYGFLSWIAIGPSQ
ncbi:hypothetical protein SAMN05661091_5363, partial [Paenibacillus uliginis N3/975]